MSCKCEHKINRDGSGQLDRYLCALDPEYAPIDGREIKDLLVYAKRYAGQIRFYDLTEHAISDETPENKVSWKEFFRRDVSVIAASIGVVDLDQIKKDYDETRVHLDSDPDASILAALYNPILGIATRLEKWLEIVIPTNPLYQDMVLAINSSLSAQLQKLKAIEEGYVVVAGADLNIDYSEIKNLELWGLDQTIDSDVSVYDGTDNESKIRNAALYIDDVFLSFYGYLSNLVDRSEGYLLTSLEDYPAHQPHMALFITFLKLFGIVQKQMNSITERMLNFYYRDVLQLEEKPSIPDRVHIIFELAKDITEHRVEKETELDGGKDASGLDQVYQTDDEIVVNQAKVAELKTLFIEKDELDVAKIKEVFARPVANSLDGYGEPFENNYPIWPTFGRGRWRNSGQNTCDKIKNEKEQYYFNNEAAIGFAVASPQLLLQGGNRLIKYSLEGLGGDDNLENILSGLEIKIKLTTEEGWLTIDNLMNDASFKNLIKDDRFGSEATQLEISYFLDKDSLFLFLPMGEVPIVAYDPKVHKTEYITEYPVMQVLFGPEVNISEDRFRDLKFSNTQIGVKVGSINPDVKVGLSGAENQLRPNMDGLTKLTLQNDTGAIDADKVFDPFTMHPNMGRSLYIGSNEVFNKPLDRLSLNIDVSVPSIDEKIFPFAATDFKLNIRERGRWKAQFQEQSNDGNTTIKRTYIFKGSDLDKDILSDMGEKMDREPIKSYSDYTSDAVKGFIQLELNTPITQGNMTNFGVSANSGVNINSFYQYMQVVAEMLKVKSISVSYESTLEKLDPKIDQFFHVYPFGVIETFIDPNEDESNKNNISYVEKLKKFNDFNASKDHLLVKANGAIFPQFTYQSLNSSLNSNTQEELNHTEGLIRKASGLQNSFEDAINQYSGVNQEEGLLYIGLENLIPQQTLTLLFQFAEGSAEDEDNDPPEIHWSYLSNNEWRPLDDTNIIADGTDGFQTTGIVKIDVPENVTNNNTIVTKGLHWFRASVAENSHRIPKLVNVVAQAVVAKFDDRNNDQSHFECPLPTESISKLVVGEAEVKSVVQPFASWDGKAKEEGKDFYIRVSERLRHKSRAINAWDYEHLILDRFPSIYKVKAITHTDPNCLCRESDPTFDPNGEVVCCGPQVAPGHVMVVPISNLKNRNTINPLQPKTSRRTLLEIEDYLKERTSPFVKVHAKNPVYEQVLVSFKVKFYSGLDKGFYLKQLNDDIVQYLTPWAFDENTDVKFGQKIYASSIINFIEERSYVDFIKDFIMVVCKDECCPKEKKAIDDKEAVDENLKQILSRSGDCADVEKVLTNPKFHGETVINPSTGRSILVSAPKHLIIPCEEEVEPDPCAKRIQDQQKSNTENYKNEVKDEPKYSGSASSTKASTTKDAAQLDKLTVVQLKKKAKEKGITGFSSMKKKDLITALISKYKHICQQAGTKNQ